jgi:hypothetical protein
MTISITGVVSNGVVIPSAPLPEGTQVEIQVKPILADAAPSIARQHSPAELRKLPREQRQAVLAAAAALAEADYRDDKELTGFDAFSEEEVDDVESR